MTPSPDTPDFNVIPDIHNSPTTIPDTSKKLQRLQLGVQVAANESRERLTNIDILVHSAIIGEQTSSLLSFGEVREDFKTILQASNQGELRRIIQDNIDNLFLAITLEEAYERMKEVVYSGENRVEENTLLPIRERVFEGEYDFSSVAGIKQFQSRNGLSADGEFGSATANKVIELGLEESLQEDLRFRVEAHKEMSQYGRKYSRGIPPTSIPKVFDDAYYYGGYKGKNIPGTFLHEDVDKLGISRTLASKENIMIFDKIQGHYVVTFYVDGELKVFSYNSPGRAHSDGGNRTPKGNFSMRDLDKYHTSSAYPRNSESGAPMPYAMNFYSGSYWVHGRFTGQGIYSHGCQGVPLKYVKALYDISEKLKSQGKKITIAVRQN